MGAEQSTNLRKILHDGRAKTGEGAGVHAGETDYDACNRVMRSEYFLRLLKDME